MKREPYSPLTVENFELMCRQWVEVILAQESGTWIWPPLNAPYRRIWQFQQDDKLRQKLLGKSSNCHILIHLDLEQKEDIGKKDLYDLIKKSICEKIDKPLSNKQTALTHLDNLTDKRKKIVNFFITGVDASIKANNWQAVEELGYLAERNWRTNVLLFLETDITDSDYFSYFSKKTTMAQNIFKRARAVVLEKIHKDVNKESRVEELEL